MPSFAVQDPEFAESVRRSFDNLTLMRTVGARLQRVAPGEVEIDLPFRDDEFGPSSGRDLVVRWDGACGVGQWRRNSTRRSRRDGRTAGAALWTWAWGTSRVCCSTTLQPRASLFYEIASMPPASRYGISVWAYEQRKFF